MWIDKTLRFLVLFFLAGVFDEIILFLDYKYSISREVLILYSN